MSVSRRDGIRSKLVTRPDRAKIVDPGSVSGASCTNVYKHLSCTVIVVVLTVHHVYSFHCAVLYICRYINRLYANRFLLVWQIH